MWRACVTGATGAVGKAVVAELLRSTGEWATISTMGRRPLDVDPALAALGEGGRLSQHTIDMEKIGGTSSLLSGCDAVFCAIGTTRKDAGSAEAFRHVDFDYVAELAKAAKAAGVKHFAYVSSQGASTSSWLLYRKTKGEIEEYLKGCAFPSLAIFRPGLLDRGDKSRAVERAAAYILPSIPVADVAKALRLQAQQSLAANPSGERPLAVTLPNAEIAKLASGGASS